MDHARRFAELHNAIAMDLEPAVRGADVLVTATNAVDVTYVVLCVYSAAGLQRVHLGVFERYGEVLSGAFIAPFLKGEWLKQPPDLARTRRCSHA